MTRRERVNMKRRQRREKQKEERFRLSRERSKTETLYKMIIGKDLFAIKNPMAEPHHLKYFPKDYSNSITKRNTA